MTSDETLSSALLTVEVNEDFTEAVLRLQDGSRLCFCHRVDERWAKAVGPEEREQEGGEAEALLSAIKMFRTAMRFFVLPFAVTIAACVSLGSAQLKDGKPITPLIELQSGPLTPGLVLDESPRPIHQIRLVVDSTLKRGMLILDGNIPEFNEFGELVGGIRTPHVRAKGKATLILEFGCSIELVKEATTKWRLHHINGPKISTTIRIATRGHMADGGPARLVVLGPDDKARAVVRCTRYGLVIP